MTVDICALIIEMLLTEGNLSVFGELPTNPVRPILRVEEAGGPSALGHINRLTIQDLQIDAWGQSKGQARQAIATARDLILIAPRLFSVRELGAITGSRCTTPTYTPDPDFPADGRPGPRYLMTATVTAHPL